MKHLKRLAIILSILGILIIVLIFIPKSKFDRENPFLAKDGMPLVMAHAGGKGVYPDNTMAAYLYSFNLGVDVLEMDVQLTADHVLVLLHGQNDTGNTIEHSNLDTVVWEETYDYLYQNGNFGYNYQEEDGSYLYRDMTSTEWQAAHVYLPTLEEVFETFGDQVLYNIEIKADADAPREDTADALHDLIVAYELEDYVLVATAFEDIGNYILENYPDLFLSTNYASAQDYVISAYTLTTLFKSKPLYAGMQVPTSYDLPVINTLRLDTRLLIHTLHQQHMAMHYWTINDEETMRFLIKQGADGIITDYPALLMQIIDELSA